jgi:hypothetical protein
MTTDLMTADRAKLLQITNQQEQTIAKPWAEVALLQPLMLRPT